MVHTPSLLLKYVSLPVVPALHISLLRTTGGHKPCIREEERTFREWIRMHVELTVSRGAFGLSMSVLASLRSLVTGSS